MKCHEVRRYYVSPCDFRFRRAKGFTLQQSFLTLNEGVRAPILSEDLRRQLWNTTGRRNKRQLHTSC